MFIKGYLFKGTIEYFDHKNKKYVKYDNIGYSPIYKDVETATRRMYIRIKNNPNFELIKAEVSYSDCKEIVKGQYIFKQYLRFLLTK